MPDAHDDLVAIGAAPRRSRQSRQELRSVVEYTLTPRVSVARVVQAHGANADQVFHGRMPYWDGRSALRRSRCGLPANLFQCPIACPTSTFERSGMRFRKARRPTHARAKMGL